MEYNPPNRGPVPSRHVPSFGTSDDYPSAREVNISVLNTYEMGDLMVSSHRKKDKTLTWVKVVILTISLFLGGLYLNQEFYVPHLFWHWGILDNHPTWLTMIFQFFGMIALIGLTRCFWKHRHIAAKFICNLHLPCPCCKRAIIK